jgi:hypothetical protein
LKTESGKLNPENFPITKLPNYSIMLQARSN